MLGWVVAAGFDAMLFAFVWIIVRDGWPESVPVWVRWPVVIAFLASATSLSVWLLGLPITEARIAHDRVVVLRRRWLLKQEEERIRPERVASVQAFEDRDGDGDAYFRCRLWLKDAGYVDLSEGHDRERIAAQAAQVRSALGVDSTPVHVSCGCARRRSR